MKHTVHTITSEDLLIRLGKVEGQIRGLQRMVEHDERCIDVLTQIASVRAALAAVGVGLIDRELRRIIADGNRNGQPADSTDVLDAVALLVHHRRSHDVMWQATE